MFVPTIFDMSVTNVSSRRHLDVSVVSCILLLPFLAGIRTALYLGTLSQLLAGSTYCSLSGMGAVLPAVWFISGIVQSPLHNSVPKRLRRALPGIHRFVFIHHFPAQQQPLCKTIFILSPPQITLLLSRAVHTKRHVQGARLEAAVWVPARAQHRGKARAGQYVEPRSARCRILTRVPFPGIEMEIVNSCEANNGGCSHSCHHTSSGPVCTCNFGYRLEEDQKTCTGKAREKLRILLLQAHLK